MVSVYAIYDKKAELFMGLNTQANDAAMIRNFSDAVKDVNSMLNRHHQDYELYCVGDYDDKSGLINCPPGYPRRICSASDFFPLSATQDVSNPFTP